jgi:hypothetical protein
LPEPAVLGQPRFGLDRCGWWYLFLTISQDHNFRQLLYRRSAGRGGGDNQEVKIRRNAARRVLALPVAALLFGLVDDAPAVGIGGLFVVWGIMSVLLGHLLVALFGTNASSRIYPSGGDQQ